jgi:23S rRNA pseudouridine1911/1915/1917 synthase
MKSGEEIIAALRRFRRQALHATRLMLTHPLSGRKISWEAPLPKDMAILLALLEQDRQSHTSKPF